VIDIQEIRAELLRSVEGLSNEALNHRTETRWSVLQVLEHLFLIEKSCSKAIAHMLTQPDAPVDAKPVERAADRTRKVPAPDAFVPADEDMLLADVLSRLDRVRLTLNATIASVEDETLWTRKSLHHPVIGTLNAGQWVDFIGFHEKRHLAQVEEIKHELKAEHIA